MKYIKKHINYYSKDREDGAELQNLYLLYNGDLYDDNAAHWFEKAEDHKNIKSFMEQFRPFYSVVNKLSQFEEMIKLCQKKYDNQLNITNIKAEVKLILNELATEMKAEVDPAYLIMDETVDDDKTINSSINKKKEKEVILIVE